MLGIENGELVYAQEDNAKELRVGNHGINITSRQSFEALGMPRRRKNS